METHAGTPPPSPPPDPSANQANPQGQRRPGTARTPAANPGEGSTLTSMVEDSGIEPLTFALPARRSPS